MHEPEFAHVDRTTIAMAMKSRCVEAIACISAKRYRWNQKLSHDFWTQCEDFCIEWAGWQSGGFGLQVDAFAVCLMLLI